MVGGPQSNREEINPTSNYAVLLDDREYPCAGLLALTLLRMTMSERAIERNDPYFFAATHGGPYLVIAQESVWGFQSYSEAEAFAKSQEPTNSKSVTIARVLFRADGTPHRMKLFPTIQADCSFERARREFGL